MYRVSGHMSRKRGREHLLFWTCKNGLDEMLVKSVLILQGFLNGKGLLCQIFLVISLHVGNQFCEFAK